MTIRDNIGANQVVLPRAPDFVHVTGEDIRLDVALLPDECLADVARLIGHAFIANAVKRRIPK